MFSSRTRGVGPQPPIMPGSRPRCSLARAGPIPTSPARSCSSASAPRMRGDGPIWPANVSQLPSCSPHARGGPVWQGSEAMKPGCSRTRRGGPKLAPSTPVTIECSPAPAGRSGQLAIAGHRLQRAPPHARRCSGLLAHDPGLQPLLPARAGVARTERTNRPRRWCVPCTRRVVLKCSPCSTSGSDAPRTTRVSMCVNAMTVRVVRSRRTRGVVCSTWARRQGRVCSPYTLGGGPVWF